MGSGLAGRTAAAAASPHSASRESENTMASRLAGTSPQLASRQPEAAKSIPTTGPSSHLGPHELAARDPEGSMGSRGPVEQKSGQSDTGSLPNSARSKPESFLLAADP